MAHTEYVIITHTNEEFAVSNMKERAEARKRTATFAKVGLHSKEHDSFHTHLSPKDAWELLAKLSKEAWMEQTGTVAPSRVDKSICKFIKLSQKL